MYFNGNTCFRRKIVYLDYPSLKERLAPSLIKPRTYFFKKVSATALKFIICFPNLTIVLPQQKSRLVFHDITYIIIYDIMYFMLAFLLFSL